LSGEGMPDSLSTPAVRGGDTPTPPMPTAYAATGSFSALPPSFIASAATSAAYPSLSP
jgi:hypothetical protein